MERRVLTCCSVKMSLAMVLWLLYTVQLIHGYYHDYGQPEGEVMSTNLYSDADALDRFQNVKRLSYRRFRGRKSCQRWNSHCFPWAKRSEFSCCYSQGLSCQCNLWMQNCRCVSKLWGR